MYFTKYCKMNWVAGNLPDCFATPHQAYKSGCDLVWGAGFSLDQWSEKTLGVQLCVYSAEAEQ